MKFLAAFAKYFPYALAGVSAIQSVLAEAPGETKKTLAVNLILAAAHVGEVVPNGAVEAVSALVDTTVTGLKNAGLLGFSNSVATSSTATIKTA